MKVGFKYYEKKMQKILIPKKLSGEIKSSNFKGKK